MKQNDHPSDQQLLLLLDGEGSARETADWEAHLAACWACRARRQELETAITGFVRVHRRWLDPELPPVEGPRALLKAQMAQVSVEQPHQPISWRLLAAVAAVVAIVAAATLLNPPTKKPSRGGAVVSVPNRSLTPGAAALVDRSRICAEDNVKNRAVPADLRRKVFEAYGIAGAAPEAYEVDYLITPALGGADDIRNLWPQSYAAKWNARVKDALEDHLRDLVCSGHLDLVTAQQDIAHDWVSAYRKYFGSEAPGDN